MPSPLIRSHAALTKKIIQDTFMGLFEKKGLAKINVTEICSISGISRSAFYQHYNDKYDVLEKIQDTLLNDLRKINRPEVQIPLNGTSTSIPRWVETASYIWENRNYFRPLINYPGDAQFIRRWNAIIREDYLYRLQLDHTMPEKHSEMMLYSMASATIGLYEYWFAKTPNVSPDELATIGSKLVWSYFYEFSDQSDQ
jgi:AcrR family transcriptional regulator